MRFLHTSDWHVGVTLGGKDRTQEHSIFLEELYNIIEEEKIEIVLISGDLFDTVNPPAEAEKLVYDFFRRMAEKRVPVVLIAGNHDSASRIEGKARLLELVNVYAFGKPQKNSKVEIHTIHGETLVVCALPFTGELRLLDWESLSQQDPGAQKASFAEKMKHLMQLLADSHFKADAVNVLMAHLTVDGAILSGSEKSIRMSDTWTVPATFFPSQASYVALGHIHKSQVFSEYVPVVYSGSPLYIDFGEANDEKCVYIVEGKSGSPLKMVPRKLERITPLKTIYTSLNCLPKTAEEYRNFNGYLKVFVRFEEEKRSGIAEEVRRLLPQTVIVNIEAPKSSKRIVPMLSTITHHPLEAYKLYLEAQGRSADTALLNAFQALMEEASRLPAENG
jgi:exonuclease SbcD